MTPQNDNHSLADAMIAHLKHMYSDEADFLEENDPDDLFDKFFFWLEDGHGDGVRDSAILLSMWELH